MTTPRVFSYKILFRIKMQIACRKKPITLTTGVLNESAEFRNCSTLQMILQIESY